MYVAPVGGQLGFLIQMPVKRDGQTVYFLSMNVFASQLQSVFSEQQLPESWNGSIIDRNGVIAARNRNAEQFVGKPVRETIMRKMQESREGFNDEGTALTGEPVTAFFSRAPRSEWRFLVSVPQVEFRRNARNGVAFIVALSIILLGGAIAAAVSLGRSTARSVEQLLDSAHRLGRGEPVQATRSGIHEFDAVSQAMAKAGADLNVAHADMERRVSEAVAIAERSQRALLQGQKLEALGRLTGGIAHDFNNVLQTLTTGLQICLMTASGEREKSLLQSCQRAVKRGVELARQLMVFGRVQDARLETLSVGLHLKIAVPLLTGALPSNIDFKLSFDDDLWNVTVDPLQFELALLNLTMNARDAMPDGGSISLEAHNETVHAATAQLPAGDYVRVTLADTGSGMSEEVSARALDPFFTTKDIGQGSGMGLPQAYGFARQSGGSLLLNSREGKGTTITIYLPRAHADAIVQSAGDERIAQQVAEGSLLFVEDDPLVRDTVAPALTLAGFKVQVAQSGDEALRLLESGTHFDLVFSDIVMPGTTSGIDLAQAVRERFPRTRIVLATGYSERRVNLPGIRLLAKPYDIEEAIAVLNNVLHGLRKQ